MLAVSSLGLLNIRTSVQLLELFDPQSRIIHDYGWLEDNFGKLVPMELIVRVPPEMQAEYVTDAENNIDQDANPRENKSSIQALTMLEWVAKHAA